MKEKILNFFRNKKTWKIVCLVAAVVSGVRLVLEGVLYLIAGIKLLPLQWDIGNAASVGIIGGADGPTAVFLTTRFGFLTETTVAAVVFAVSLFFYIRLRKQK